MGLSFLVAIVSIWITGCADPVTTAPKVTPKSNSFIVTGGNYQNSLFNSSTTITHDTGYYYTSSGLTRGNIIWTNGSAFVQVNINFSGKKTGTFNIGSSAVTADTNCVNIIHTAAGGVGTAKFLSILGTLNVTSYDAVGGKISGNFSGTFVDDAFQYYTITNGQFSELRGNDK